ncbi:11378_t:CDS:2 [Entrophospora sp. SA101]|nr:11378_t:CDS:2 [Entrophospora sp. SA101]
MAGTEVAINNPDNNNIVTIIELSTKFKFAIVTNFNMDMEICSPGSFEILRCDTKLNNLTNIQNGCQEYISGPIINITEGADDKYCCYTFKANKAIEYTHGKPDGLNKLKFYYNINATDAEKEKLGVALIQIRVFSPDLLDVSEMDKAVRSRINLQWDFMSGIIGYISLIKFKTSIYKSIPPRDASAIIGFEPNYATTPRIDCTISQFPFNQNPLSVPNGTSLNRVLFTSTILSSIASAGGAFGLIGSILVWLYGSSSFDEWGFARRMLDNPWYWVDKLKGGYESLNIFQTSSKTLTANDHEHVSFRWDDNFVGNIYNSEVVDRTRF